MFLAKNMKKKSRFLWARILYLNSPNLKCLICLRYNPIKNSPIQLKIK